MVLLVASALAIALAGARAQTGPASLHPLEARLRLPSVFGFVRVPLGADIVAEAGPDLARLRLVAANGEAVPFAVQTAPRTDATTARNPASVPLEASQTTEPGPPVVYLEQYELELPTAAAPGEPWQLELVVPSALFTAEVTLTRIEAGAESTTTHTVFRLADGASRTTLALPPLPAPDARPSRARAGRAPNASAPRLRVALRGQDGHLSPTFVFVSRTDARAGTELEIPFAETLETRGRGTTTFTVRASSGLRPSAIRLRTSTPSFVRPIRVEALVGDRVIDVGRGEVRAGTGIDATSLAIEPFAAERFRIVLDDGSSPPLAGVTLTAVVARPTLVFDARHAVGDENAMRLVFGGVRALPPRYPEAESFASIPTEPLPEATLGPIATNPAYRDAPAFGFAMVAGAEVDVRAYRHRVPLRVPASTEGVVRVALPVHVVAAAATALADLRIVDARDRQWPYVVLPAERARYVDVALRTEPNAEEARSVRASTYRLDLPEQGFVVRELRLDPGAALVDRAVRVLGFGDDDRPYPIAETRLVRRPGSEATTVVRLDGRRHRRLRIVVDDGDDAPLSLRAAVAFDEPALYLTAPEGEYALLVGSVATGRDRTPPVYELASARALLLSVRPTDAQLGAMAENPRFEPPSAFSRERGKDLALWIALGLATIVLLALTFRLAREGDA